MWGKEKAGYSSLGDFYGNFHKIRVRILKKTVMLEAIVIRKSLFSWTKFQSDPSGLEVRESIAICV